MRLPFGTTGLARSLGLAALVLSTTCNARNVPPLFPAPFAPKDATTTTTVTTVSTTVTNLVAASSLSVPTAAIATSARRTRSRRPLPVFETVTVTVPSATSSVEDNSVSASGSSDVAVVSTKVVTDVVVVSQETISIIYDDGLFSTTGTVVASRGVVSAASDVSSSSSAGSGSTSIEAATLTVFSEVVSTSTSTVGVSSSIDGVLSTTEEVSDSTSTDNAVITRKTTITMAEGIATATLVETPTSVETVTSVVTVAPETLPTSFVTLSRRAGNAAVSSKTSSPSSTDEDAISVEVATLTVMPGIVFTTFTHRVHVSSSSTDTVSDPPSSTLEAVTTRRVTNTVKGGDVTESVKTVPGKFHVTIEIGERNVVRSAASVFAPTAINPAFTAFPIGHGPVIVKSRTLDALETQPGDAAVSSSGSSPTAARASASTPVAISPLFTALPIGHGPVVIKSSILDAPETLPTAFVTSKRTGDAAVSSSGSSSPTAVRASASTPAGINPVFTGLPTGHGPVVIKSSALFARETLPTAFVTLTRTGDAAVSPTADRASASTPALAIPLFTDFTLNHGPVVIIKSSSLDVPESLPTGFVTSKRIDNAAISSSGSSFTATGAGAGASAATSTTTSTTTSRSTSTSTSTAASSSSASASSTSAAAAPVSSTTSDGPLLTITRSTTSKIGDTTETAVVAVATPTPPAPPAAPVVDMRSTLDQAKDGCIACQDIFEDKGVVPPETVKRSLESLEEPLDQRGRRVPGGKLIPLVGGGDVAGESDVRARQLIPPMLPHVGDAVGDYADATVNGGDAAVARQLIPPMLPGFSVNGGTAATHKTRATPIYRPLITNNADHAAHTNQPAFSPIRRAPASDARGSLTAIYRSRATPIYLPPITDNADHTAHTTHSPIRLAPVNNMTIPTHTRATPIYRPLITNNADHAAHTPATPIYRPLITKNADLHTTHPTPTPIRLAPVNNMNITIHAAAAEHPTDEVYHPEPLTQHKGVDKSRRAVPTDHPDPADKFSYLEPLSQGTAKSKSRSQSRRAATDETDLPLLPLNTTTFTTTFNREFFNPYPKSPLSNSSPANSANSANPLAPRNLLSSPTCNCAHNNNPHAWRDTMSPMERATEICMSGGGCKITRDYEEMCVMVGSTSSGGTDQPCACIAGAVGEYQSHHRGTWWIWSAVHCGGIAVVVTDR